MPAKSTLLRLHTAADGMIWLGRDTSAASATGLDTEEFFRQGLELAEGGTVRVTGEAANAGLLVELCRHYRSPLLRHRLQVFAPLPVGAGRLPALILQMLCQPLANVPRHELTEGDAATYAIVASLRAEAPAADRLMLFRRHPLWLAFSFLPQFDPEQACRFLALVIDPRWYRHGSRPQRFSRLYSYLGLCRRNIEAFRVDGVGGYRWAEADTAIRSWYLPDYERRRGECLNFLHRSYQKSKDKRVATLRTTQLFVRFVCSVWFWNDLQRPNSQAVFDPFAFFADTEDAKLFAEHQAAQREDRRCGS